MVTDMRNGPAKDAHLRSAPGQRSRLGVQQISFFSRIFVREMLLQ